MPEYWEIFAGRQPSLGNGHHRNAPGRDTGRIRVRATDAKEVGLENPAEETFCHPNRFQLSKL